jgi:hypothetical protein
MDPRIYSLALVAAALVLGGIAVSLRGRKSPEERERERREWLTANGRIVDGTITDVQELNANGRGEVQLLLYQYDVSGVSYEASQDVTYLRQWLDLHSCRLGLNASIKYDPHNPGNSIVIAEGWSGVRTAIKPPGHEKV